MLILTISEDEILILILFEYLTNTTELRFLKKSDK